MDAADAITACPAKESSKKIDYKTDNRKKIEISKWNDKTTPVRQPKNKKAQYYLKNGCRDNSIDERVMALHTNNNRHLD